MKLTIIFTISFFTVALFLGIGESFYYQNSLNRILKQDVFSHLKMITELKVNQIEKLLTKTGWNEVDVESNKVLMSRLTKITEDTTGLWNKGEVYVVNKNGYLLTSSRFLSGENRGILTQKVSAKNSMECQRDTYGWNESGGVYIISKNSATIFKDYRGEEVFGYHIYLPRFQWCVVSKVDKDQILGNGHNTPKPLIIVIFTIYTIAFIGFVFGRYLDKKYKLKKR